MQFHQHQDPKVGGYADIIMSSKHKTPLRQNLIMIEEKSQSRVKLEKRTLTRKSWKKRSLEHRGKFEAGQTQMNNVLLL